MGGSQPNEPKNANCLGPTNFLLIFKNSKNRFFHIFWPDLSKGGRARDQYARVLFKSTNITCCISHFNYSEASLFAQMCAFD